ncbi:MAG TPA: hypothetical protein VIL30_14435 [Ramlibacter sp.]|jgi:hypothetical protein
MSATAATELVRKMVYEETRNIGDTQLAMQGLARRIGIGFWTLDHLRKGRAKSCDATLMSRIRAAYVDLCARQIEHLQNEIEIEKAVSNDDTLADLELEIASLAKKIQARRAAR